MLRFLSLLLTLIICGNASAVECIDRLYQSKKFIACQVDLRKERVDLYWKDKDNRPYGSLFALQKEVLKVGKHMFFAINAGMYQQDLAPLGLFVSEGKTLHPMNLRTGNTNFYMNPNGVFYVDSAGAGILPTSVYKLAKNNPRVATQSGPILILNGKITNSAVMSPSSKSTNIRNAVCVTDVKRPKFVISEDVVTFYDLASFLLNDLHCKNALYLDGGVSSIYAPQIHRKDSFSGIGTFLVVTDEH